MADTFNVTAAYDKPAGYNQGDKITVTITGNATKTTVTQGAVGPLTLTLTDAAGDTSTVVVPANTASITTTIPEAVTITKVTDTGTNPRPWTIAADGKSAFATA